MLDGRVRRITGLDTERPVIEEFAGAGIPRMAEIEGPPPDDRDGADRRDVSLTAPAGLAFDAKGNLYVSELGGSGGAGEVMKSQFGIGFTVPADVKPGPTRIRKIARDGTVTTVAGPGGRFFTDPGGADALVLPLALAIDPRGRMVIGDVGTNMLRILPAGSF